MIWTHNFESTHSHDCHLARVPHWDTTIPLQHRLDCLAKPARDFPTPAGYRQDFLHCKKHTLITHEATY